MSESISPDSVVDAFDSNLSLTILKDHDQGLCCKYMKEKKSMQELVMERSRLVVRLRGFQLLSFFLVLVLLGITHTIVHAQSTDNQPDFALQPVSYNPAVPATKSYLILDGKSGTTLPESVRVVNIGTATGSVSVYPVSAATSQSSGIVYLSKNDPLRDVAAWIKMGQQQLTLAPGQSQVVTFQIVIPASAHPGLHLGAITAENLVTEHSPGGGQIHVVLRKLSNMAIQVSLPGPIVEQMVVTGAKAGGSNGYQKIILSMSNNGDTILKPFGELKVSDSQGQLLQDLPVKLNSLLPDTDINYPVYVQNKALIAGSYSLLLVLHYGHGKTLNYTTTLTITQQQVQQVFQSSGPLQAPNSGSSFLGSMPLWQLLLVGFAAAVILFMGIRKVYGLIAAYRRKRAHAGQKAASSAKKRTNKAA